MSISSTMWFDTKHFVVNNNMSDYVMVIQMWRYNIHIIGCLRRTVW